MKLRSSFEDWDFLKTWSIEDGKSYPMLRWQEGAPQSGFEAEAIEGWVVPDISFWLTISEAMDEDGKPLYGSHQVTIYSDLDDSGSQVNAEFSYGEAEVPVILKAVGKHNLRVSVEGISYSNLVTINVLTGFFRGSGKPDDPFLIDNVDQLNEVRHFPNAYFKLNGDIDLGTLPYNEGKGWEPIGQSLPFQGGFDGGGYVIRNLTINRLCVGLFGKTQNAVLCNIRLENVSVSGMDHVGALVGDMGKGTIESCQASGSVNGNNRVGGLVGTNFAGKISNSSAGVKVVVSVDPSGTYIIAGGLVGFNGGGTISDSHATGDVSGQLYVGGLVGWNSNAGTLLGEISGSSASGQVTGEEAVGGLLGINDGIVYRAHAAGPVEGRYWDYCMQFDNRFLGQGKCKRRKQCRWPGRD